MYDFNWLTAIFIDIKASTHPMSIDADVIQLSKCDIMNDTIFDSISNMDISPYIKCVEYKLLLKYSKYDLGWYVPSILQNYPTCDFR